MGKGKITYIPGNIMDTINNIKKEKNISEQSVAFNELNNYANIGREAEKLYKKLGFR